MTVLAGLVPVFLLLLLGLAVRRLGVLSEEGADGLNRVVASVALPALLLLKIGTSPLEECLAPVLAVAGNALIVAATVVAWLLATAWRLPAAQRGVFTQAATRGNIAYVAFPVVLGAYGDSGLRLAAVTAATLFPLMNLVAVAALERARGESESAGRLLLRVLGNPLVWGSLLGLALAAVHWHPWPWLEGTLQILADFALPGALLALGAQLRLEAWHGVWRQAIAATALKTLVQPLVAFVILRALGAAPLETAVGTLLMAAPTAVATYSVAAELGGDTDLAGACVVASTVAALPAYALCSVLLSL
jgi:malate permease and related proteins